MYAAVALALLLLLGAQDLHVMVQPYWRGPGTEPLNDTAYVAATAVLPGPVPEGMVLVRATGRVAEIEGWVSACADFRLSLAVREGRLELEAMAAGGNVTVEDNGTLLALRGPMAAAVAWLAALLVNATGGEAVVRPIEEEPPYVHEAAALEVRRAPEGLAVSLDVACDPATLVSVVRGAFHPPAHAEVPEKARLLLQFAAPDPLANTSTAHLIAVEVYSDWKRVLEPIEQLGVRVNASEEPVTVSVDPETAYAEPMTWWPLPLPVRVRPEPTQPAPTPYTPKPVTKTATPPAKPAEIVRVETGKEQEFPPVPPLLLAAFVALSTATAAGLATWLILRRRV